MTVEETTQATRDQLANLAELWVQAEERKAAALAVYDLARKRHDKAVAELDQARAELAAAAYKALPEAFSSLAVLIRDGRYAVHVDRSNHRVMLTPTVGAVIPEPDVIIDPNPEEAAR